MKYHVALHHEARKFLARQQRPQRERIAAGLRALEGNPFTPRSGADIKKLHGTHGRGDLYRLRIGKYRAVYKVEGVDILVTQLWERGHGYDV